MNKKDSIQMIIIGISLFIITLFIILFSNAKFCPKCGRRYIADVSYCKNDGMELKDIG